MRRKDTDNTVIVDGDAMKTLRKSKGLTHDMLAEKVGVTVKTIARMEHGEPAYLSTLQMLAEALEVSPDVLLKNKLSVESGKQIKSESHDVLASYLCNFQAIVEALQSDFVGRDFVYDQIDAYLRDQRFLSGYILIEGDPGIGKSALLASLIHRRNYGIHHFNISLQSINTPKQFMGNICTRIIREYGLGYETLPPDYGSDGRFLNTLLSDISPRLSANAPLVIVIDALDEVEGSRQQQDSNLLYLPASLPDHIYIIATTRHFGDLRLRVMSSRIISIQAKSDDNQKDIRQYLGIHAKRPLIKSWARVRHLDTNEFVDMMADKSEGNFMYLHYVLPAIEQKMFDDSDVQSLPHGLKSYYRGHWAVMRKTEGRSFDTVFRAVVCVLAASKQSVPVGQIVRWTKLEEYQILEVIQKWREFLHIESWDGCMIYRLYHSSFREFLQEEVDPGLKQFNRMIVDAGQNELDGLTLS